jgi:hypothetical protein
MRLQHVVGVFVLVPFFARGMTVAVAVLMGVRMGVRVRMLMIVHGFAVLMLMPVCMSMLMIVLMPVLVLMILIVTSFHRFTSFACLPLHDRDRRSPRIPAVSCVQPVLLLNRVLPRVRRWQAGCNRRPSGACQSRRAIMGTAGFAQGLTAG